MFVQILNTHPHIVYHGELLRKKNVAMKGPLKVLKFIDSNFLSEQFRHEHPAALIDQVFGLTEEESRVIGFKLMLGQHVAYRDKLIADSRVSKILLYRHNMLAIYSSEKIAKITGQGIVKSFHQVKKAKADFYEKEFMQFWKQREKQYTRVRELAHRFSQPLLELEYLSLVNGDGIRASIRFLGQDPDIGDLKTTTKKRNPSTILDRFTNPKKVEKFIEKKGLHLWMNETFPKSIEA